MAGVEINRLRLARELLLPLLRHALGGTVDGGLEALSARLTQAEPAEWTGLLSLAREQAVSGLICDALERLGGGVPVPDPVSVAFLADAGRIELRSRKVRTLSEKLLRGLEEEGLHPVLMKGPAVARFYPRPDLRTSGDIDLYLPREEQDRARRCLGPASFRAAPDGSYCGMVEGVVVELHDRFYDLHLRRDRLPAPQAPEAVPLMLSAHILKHALGPGIGIRQFCDLMQACKALEEACDRTALLQAYRRAGMTGWNRLLASFLLDVLGFETPLLPDGTAGTSESLQRIVFGGGDFGRFAHSRGRALSDSARRRKLDTASRFAQRIPFALRYAPREFVFYLAELVRGNLA